MVKICERLTDKAMLIMSGLLSLVTAVAVVASMYTTELAIIAFLW